MMQKIINAVIDTNKNIFGENPTITKINVGFTNTIYNINDQLIVKICTDFQNEENFKKEIAFYKANKENPLIPKLYYANTEKKDIPYNYEILKKIEGVSLYNIWHTLNEEQREDIVKQICMAMKQIHSNKGQAYNWTEYCKEKFLNSYTKAKVLGVLSQEEQSLIEEAYSKFDQYLKSEEFVLIHNDLHFDNIFYKNGTIKFIDFERSMYAPKDFELDILFRMARMPWKYASEETEQYVKEKDYKNIKEYVKKYYKELIDTPHLLQRLAIYDAIYFFEQFVNCPEEQELKLEVLEALKRMAKPEKLIR